MYVKIINNNPIYYPNFEKIRQDMPDTSFPEILNDNILAENNIFPLSIDPIPNISISQKAVPAEIIFENGHWVQHWNIINLDDVELELEHQKMAGEARQKRNQLLQETDWTQGKDISDSISNLWISYRQALRDITIQSDFPANISWPEKPA